MMGMMGSVGSTPKSEELRLAKASVRTRYLAPKHLRGRPMRLVDGRRLNIPEHGFRRVVIRRCAPMRRSTSGATPILRVRYCIRSIMRRIKEWE